MIKLKQILTENKNITKLIVDINPDDIVLGGKFKNKPYTVASFSKDENNQPIIITNTGKELKFLSIRIKKLLPKKDR